jgi:cell division inhibitor SulA
MKAALAELLHNPLLWQGDRLARAEDAVASGFAALDRELPGGGWPQASLTELLLDHQGIGELRLVLPALKALVRAGEWIALIAPPHVPYAPAFARHGIDPGRVIVVESAEEKNRWWSAEQVLRANSAGAMLFWPRVVNDAQTRRLQLAAQESQSLAFVFTGTARAAHPSPAPLRIRLSLVEQKLCIDVFKRRGGVMSKPLMLDMAAVVEDVQGAMAQGTGNVSPVAAVVKPLMRAERVAVNRSASFNRHYPVGGPQAKIWNRALSRADEVQRVPGVDPRSGDPRLSFPRRREPICFKVKMDSRLRGNDELTPSRE